LDFVYFLSKAFWFLARPGNLILLIILIGTLVAWVRPAKSGRIWLTALSALLLFVAFAPVYTWISRPLEDRFPPPASLPAKIDGILVLGGFSSARIADHSGQISIDEAAERIMVAAALTRLHPEARLVITGRGVDHPTISTWLSDMGLESGRIAYEPEARNTFENAVLSHRMIQPGPNEVWLLVTSAQHMPRAVGVFRKIDWPVIPYPVDYETAEIEMLASWPGVAGSLKGLNSVMKEWVGLVAYYVMDRTDELFPAPQT
jgi:uncharacterized SAM-binding protein YcdF (DUF218 family)